LFYQDPDLSASLEKLYEVSFEMVGQIIHVLLADKHCSGWSDPLTNDYDRVSETVSGV